MIEGLLHFPKTCKNSLIAKTIILLFNYCNTSQNLLDDKLYIECSVVLQFLLHIVEYIYNVAVVQLV